VYKALLTRDGGSKECVAVKMLKGSLRNNKRVYLNTQSILAANRSDVLDFFNEGLQMRYFDHPRVLRLIGISIDAQYTPLILTPYMQNGDLLTYLKKSSSVSVFLYIFSIRLFVLTV
jgi:serine/threonine protein kinase